ncbi:hypothetical protein FE257_012339 [Aspergillus nanangensis]|uniref:Heme haloperoxidase family profile domain-containing protein n=1 Tax=Aspergillus nanangensis TaxID=2582783 RepID=A0AAD4CGA4_ASPNN|nr:hypothetical protein FE257_012339 [Aspergillus nanangensis]
MLGGWSSILALTLLGPASIVGAFPSAEHVHKLMGGAGHPHRNKSGCPFAGMKDFGDLKDDHSNEIDKRFLFSLMNKPVDVTGDHEFQPPNWELGDQRGPCPGLNALANHAYIPRSGVVSFFEYMEWAWIWPPFWPLWAQSGRATQFPSIPDSPLEDETPE